jgi:HAE1 family hydrophobic/amphiphilic exporter-1
VFGGFGFAPLSDNSELNVAIETPPSSTVEYTALKAEEVATIARRHPEVAYTYTTVGSSSGSGAVDNATVYVRLVPKRQRQISQDVFGQQLRKELGHVGGATAYTYAAGGLAGNQKQLQLQLQGPNANTLAQLAEPIADSVRAAPGAVDVGFSSRGQKPEFNVEVNRSLASTLGVSLGQLALSLRYAFAGVDAGTWVDPSGISRYVHVRLVSSARANANDLGQLPVMVAPNGATPGAPIPFVPLSQVATITTSTGPAQIDHYQRQRVVTIGANVIGASVGNVNQDVMRRVNSVQLPPGYHITQGGQVESQNQVAYTNRAAKADSTSVRVASRLLEPEGLTPKQSVCAASATRRVEHYEPHRRDDAHGIVAKNAILLIDFKWARHDRGPAAEVLIEAGRTRLRPIMMTTLR